MNDRRRPYDEPWHSERSGCDRCRETTLRVDDHDLRCECGSLLARKLEHSFAIKCRRCKRTVVLPLH